MLSQQNYGLTQLKSSTNSEFRQVTRRDWRKFPEENLIIAPRLSTIKEFNVAQRILNWMAFRQIQTFHF